MSSRTNTKRVPGLVSNLPTDWRPSIADAAFVRDSTAEQVRRLRGPADAYGELLLRRLAARGEPPTDFAVDGELPGEDEL